MEGHRESKGLTTITKTTTSKDFKYIILYRQYSTWKFGKGILYNFGEVNSKWYLKITHCSLTMLKIHLEGKLNLWTWSNNALEIWILIIWGIPFHRKHWGIHRWYQRMSWGDWPWCLGAAQPSSWSHSAGWTRETWGSACSWATIWNHGAPGDRWINSQHGFNNATISNHIEI